MRHAGETGGNTDWSHSVFEHVVVHWLKYFHLSQKLSVKLRVDQTNGTLAKLKTFRHQDQSQDF